ncbi:MAG: DUF6666 family protein [Planctomycetaceae bacterium]
MTMAIRTLRFGSILGALAAAVFATALAAEADTAAGAGQAQLKWTPHRASAAPVVEASPTAEPRAATPPRLQTVPAGAATVQLPDEVPAVAPARTRPTPPPTTRAPVRQPRRPSPAPVSPDAVLGVDLFRTPTRGGAARPILDDETPAGAARRQVERLGNGLAPRPVGGRRPERLTAGIDALPSVMRQGPQEQIPAQTDAVDPPEAIPTPAPRDAGGMPGTAPPAMDLDMPGDPTMMGGPDGLMLGDYPSELHVESFYDDPYACEDDDPLCQHSGRICAWLRRFGRPYYGWRWYRDFTAGAGAVAFTNAADLGLNGNFGFNEYLNQGMPFWNAFGVGWQVGVRGTQTNFQDSNVNLPGGRLHRTGRDQVFVTTGFFTRAFEGRGLQGGAVYDYLHDNLYDDIDVSQLRYELSYVWGYHEVGFWGATNIGDQNGIFSPVRKNPGVASTLDLYTAFYRLQFGDANEWKVWGGGTGYGDGIVGSIVRAPMSRSWGLEGFFTYVIPGNSQTVNYDGQGTTSTYAPAAWNVGVNVVFHPGGRSRRSLASPYRPLFDVADNGTMIRRLGVVTP